MRVVVLLQIAALTASFCIGAEPGEKALCNPRTASESYRRTGAAGIRIACAYPGGNVKVISIDEKAGVVRVAPDLRDTEGHWFHFDFTVRGAERRTLKFLFPEDGNPYLSSLGPAICSDGVRWRWLRADGVRHEPANAYLATCCEFGYSLCGGVNSREAMRELGANLFKAVVRTAKGNERN